MRDQRSENEPRHKKKEQDLYIELSNWSESPPRLCRVYDELVVLDVTLWWEQDDYGTENIYTETLWERTVRGTDSGYQR